MPVDINDPHNILDSLSRRLDAEAAARADLRLDAEDGRLLLSRLEAAWWEQGVAAYEMGLSPDSLWNEFQRQGYRQAQALAKLQEVPA